MMHRIVPGLPLLMRRRFFVLLPWLSALALPLAAAVSDRPNTPPDALDATALVGALRAGGLVLYLRHGRTDLSTRDEDRRDLTRCDRQRRLSDEGRREMRAIGDTIRRLGIPVGRVLASPYCRARESAELAFGRAETEPGLAHSIDADTATAQARTELLTRLLSTVPAAGSNTVIAGHSGNLLDASGWWPAPEGVMLVFRPLGGGRFEFVARIPPERWAALARSATR